MYTSFFGFKENPFNLTPDPRYLFLSSYHKEALDHLLYGINERKGFIAITGGIGTGKTTLCRALLSHLDESTRTALVLNAFTSDMELLETINQEFGIEDAPKSETKKGYIDLLNGFLLENFSNGGNAVLLIDEAQNLSRNVLEEIRMLSNLETEREKLIQIVLVGQPELKELLNSYSLKQLNDRIMVRYDLKPLDPGDVKGYIEHRMVVAGGKGNLAFTKGAIQKIYEYSQGNPRRINAVSDRALLLAYARGKNVIPKEMMGQAIEEIRGARMVEPRRAGWSWRKVASLSALLLTLIVVAGFGGWSYRAYILKILKEEPKRAEVKIPQALPQALPKAPLPEKKASLFLDEKTSLSVLFDLFNVKEKGDNAYLEGGHLGLISFSVEPEYYVMFKKPFRVSVVGPEDPTSANHRYLLIRQITGGEGIAVDAEGKERRVSRSFILEHWGRKVSWAYSYKSKAAFLRKGMSLPDVAVIQRSLNDIGYLLKPTGIYDESTYREVRRFQMDFGLMPDGIVGLRTRALLFQMSRGETPQGP